MNDFTPNRADLEAALDPRTREFRDMVRLTPATLAHYRTGGMWKPAPHLLSIASLLASELRQGDARIIVEVPPRHGKSELISYHTPIWFLDWFPWAKVMLTTYAAELSTGFGRRVRDAFLENQSGILSTRIKDDAQKMSLFVTSEEGGMTSVGIGGPITGKGAHLLLVDDFVKNWEEASSDSVLDGIFNWFTTTAYTRLEPGGSCVILATRWVVNDLIGRLIEQDKDKVWTVIRYPAIAEAGDPLGRAVGQALWPERYNEASLLRTKSILGDFMFDALYQQNPRKIGEVKVDISNIRYTTEISSIPRRWCRSWDLAATDGAIRSDADWTVGTLMGTEPIPGLQLAKTLIADQVRGQWDPSGVEEIIRTTALADGVNVPVIIEQEPGASGKSWANHLKNNVLPEFEVHTVPPGGRNKYIRAQPYMAALNNGRVTFVQAPWNAAHEGELKTFPGGKNDDTVDSAAIGYSFLHSATLGSATWGRTDSGIYVPTAGVGQLPTSTVSGLVWGR